MQLWNRVDKVAAIIWYSEKTIMNAPKSSLLMIRLSCQIVMTPDTAKKILAMPAKAVDLK